MEKYALIGLGSGGSKAIDSFDYDNANIDKIAIDSDEECLNSLQNSRTLKISIEKEDEDCKLPKEDKDKILNLINKYDKVCFMVCLGGHTGVTIIKENAKFLKDDDFIIAQTSACFEGRGRNNHVQEVLSYLKKHSKNIFVIDIKNSIERTVNFTEDDRIMASINRAILWKHRKDFMEKFENIKIKRGNQ